MFRRGEQAPTGASSLTGTRVSPAIPLRDLLLVLALSLPATAAAVADVSEGNPVERGRYLVQIALCNDCHTPGYADSGGKTPEDGWLTGDAIGWKGPWGTTYPSNLRLALQHMTEAQWLTIARTVEFRPPMPWFALRAMAEDDLRAIYAYIRNLGPAGEPAPAYLPPGQEPNGAYYEYRGLPGS